jgi:hypothetical protein
VKVVVFYVLFVDFPLGGGVKVVLRGR